MDIKSILNKIEECKKDSQKKELIKNFKYCISNTKTKKAYEQILKLNYEKTLNKLFVYKEFDTFLEILISIIKNISALSEAYRQKYQEIILNLIIPKKIKTKEALQNNLNYFLVATNDLEDINNIKNKHYLIYYLFFKIFLKLKLDMNIIDLFIKLEKYMTKYQYEIIIYVLTIYSFNYKNEDFPEQMIILKKIIDFCKFDFSNETSFTYKNYDLTKNIIIMLLLYTPFKQEILINLYNIDPNYFMQMIQDIIIYFGNYLQGNSNKFNIIYNTDLININNFFGDDVNEIDFEEIDSKNNVLYNYFNNKEYFIKKYNKFIQKINLKEIFNKNKYEVYKGIIWTLSSIILKNYYSSNDNNIFNENKNHSTRLFTSLISIFQYIDPEHQKSYIKQYLELIKSLITEINNIEEWPYILDILSKCAGLIIKKEQKKEVIEKEFKIELNLLNEIFDIILNLYNKKQMLYCDLENLSLILHKCNHFLQKDSLMSFYIELYLTNEHKLKRYTKNQIQFNDNLYSNFLNNLETLFFNIFSLPPKMFSNTKNYLLEIIRANYLNDKHTNLVNKDNNDLTKQAVIEKVLEKYLENIFISAADNEQNYTFFNYILLEILYKTNNLNFLNQILALLIFNNNEKIYLNLYNEFVTNILTNLFENLINNPSKCILVKEKLSFLIDFFYGENNMNDENIFKLGLNIVKYFVVNNRYEIIFVKNVNSLNNDDYDKRHSMLVIDFLYNKILYNENDYEPYIVFHHIKLFEFINTNLENYIKKINICESIFEFYYSCFSKNFLFLKNVNLNPFFKTIFEEKELTKISSSKRITNYIIKILSYLPYQLNSDMNFDSSRNIELNIKQISLLDDEIQLNAEPKYKISIINFLINFWKNLNDIIKKTLSNIFLDGQLSQTIFKENNKNFHFTFSDKSIRTSIYNFLNKGKSFLWCGELNLYSQFDYLYDCIKLLKIYLISYTNDLIRIKNNNNNFNDKENINNNKAIFSELKGILLKIFIEIFNSINFKYFNKKYSYFIISLLYEIKELLVYFISEEIKVEIKNIKRKSFSYSNINEQYNKTMALSEQKNLEKIESSGIYMVYKAIYIALFLSWNYEEKICSSFDKFLKINYKSKLIFKDKFIILEKFYDQKKCFDEGLQNLIEHLSDILNLYLMQNIPEKNINVLINILDEIFREQATYREYFFYKMAEWCLKIRKTRDSLNINYKSIFDLNFLNNINNNYPEDDYIGQKILKDSFVFYGNNSLIIINPINSNKYCFTLRNPVSNMSLIFDTNVPIINYYINKNESMNLVEEEEEEEDDDEEENDENKKDKEEKSNSFSNDSLYLKDNTNSIKENKNDNKIFEFEEGNDETIKNQRKNSGDNINNDDKIIFNKYEKNKAREFEDKINNRNNMIYPIRGKRFNTDLGDKYKKSIILAEKKKKMKNCLKLFSILTELTDFKIEQYKWFDIYKNNNLYNITKLIQNLDILPLYFIHNCAIIFHSNDNENNPYYLNSIASYMYFIQKLGLLYNYNDIYPDLNKRNNNINMNNNEKYIMINQDSFTRINFNILNLTEKNENQLLEENNIIFIWTENLDEYQIPKDFISQDKFKIFFIITKISERLYKIQRKYNSKRKSEIVLIIDELFLNEFIIDIENQSSIQMVINMIKNIDILIKVDVKNNNKNKIDFMDKNKDNKEFSNNIEKTRVKSMILDNKSILISDNYINATESSGSNFDLSSNYIDEKELLDDSDSSLKKRYLLLSKL